MSEEPHPACLSSHIEFDTLDRLKTYATETYSYDADGNRISLKAASVAWANGRLALSEGKPNLLCKRHRHDPLPTCLVARCA